MRGEKMKFNTTILLLIVLMCFSLPANSTLIDRGTGLIYDTDQGITWLQDANYAQTSGYDSDGIMNWNEATTWVSDLAYGGFNDWRLPTTPAVHGESIGWVNEGEMAHLYYNQGITFSTPGLYNNLGNNQYWTGSNYESDTNTIWDFSFSRGRQGLTNVSSSINLSWAVRDGDYGPSVSTDQTYLSEFLTLGDTFSFDYFWDMGVEPTEFNIDVLIYGGNQLETFGLEFNFDGSSTDWATAYAYVPEWARGMDAQILFGLIDGGQTTNPTVYLNNIASNGTAPVPEPATILLVGTGLAGLAGVRFRRKKK